jgi:Domain of unknown function (4846)
VEKYGVKSSILLFLFLYSNLFAQDNIFLAPQVYNLKKYSSIENEIPVPTGFQRVAIDSNSFAAYLRTLPIVDASHGVLDFKGRVRVKTGDSSLAAVVPVDIAGKNLWQCMDIILAFKVDFLNKEKRMAEIVFPLPEGTKLSWEEWQNGIRPSFKGLHFYKSISGNMDNSQKSFKKYVNTIFNYSNTQTFYHHYPAVELAEIKPGDFIVKKGKKGHAVFIVDVAENEYGEKIALIGQGDTPACQFYVLKNKQGSPWFKIHLDSKYPDLPISKKMFWLGLRRFPY